VIVFSACWPAQSSIDAPDPGKAFFDFFAFAVETSTGEKALADSLAEAGLDPKAGTAPMYRELEDATEALLNRAQDAGDIRPDVGMPEVLALITSSCLAADRQQWGTELRARTLRVIFDGLRPPVNSEQREEHQMSVLTETDTLSNGNQIPKIGFGTWLLKEGDECYNAVADALRLGYRHIDTARGLLQRGIGR
jgi:hypothetical protein